MFAKVEKYERKFTEVNAVDYDVKSCRSMTATLSCTDVRLKIFRILIAHKRDLDTVNDYVTQIQYFK